MKILVIGGGGREHALVWKIAQSPKVRRIYCAPGNPGIAQLATCVAVGVGDIRGLLDFAQRESIDLTVVGPEAPLSAGLVDSFAKAGLKVFGATRKAAEIESSKSFSKQLLLKYRIPTAAGETFSAFNKAQSYVHQKGTPLVIKADGLAAGKGVIVCTTEKEAFAALDLIMRQRAFGDAGNRVVVEDFLTGEEVSFLAFTDGQTVLPLPTSQDHKAVYDQDKGPNTGGMGAYSPAPIVDRYLHQKIMQEIMIPTVRALAAEGRPYKGVLYAGLMIDGDRIKVLEFNARFGDPEAQPLLMRIQTDIVPVMEAVIAGQLDKCRLEIDPRPAICVVMASGGYPGDYRKGVSIAGLEKVKRMRDMVVFHAGTALEEKQLVTNGGRVLGVTSLGMTIQKAQSRAYQAVAKIAWDGAHFRRDIGQKALKRMATPPSVGIVMGSDSDVGVMDGAAAMLTKFGIPYEMTVASAHRSPERAATYAVSARERGLKVIIAGAGHAAHLAGVLAAHTSLPVIGVPIDSSCLQGMDALLATVQMPPGIPVGTVSIGKPGGRNAGILAAQILGITDPAIAKRLERFKQEMAREVARKAEKLEQPQ